MIHTDSTSSSIILRFGSLRSIANLIALLGSKATVRAWKSKTKLNKNVIEQFAEALKVCQEHGLEIPGGLQALATDLSKTSSDTAAADQGE